jgi:hypothetical protein
VAPTPDPQLPLAALFPSAAIQASRFELKQLDFEGESFSNLSGGFERLTS